MSRGSILILALWALCALTIFAVQLGTIVRQKLALMDRLDSRSRLYFIAEAGVQRAFAELREIDKKAAFNALNETWSSRIDAFKDIPVGDGTYNVTSSYDDKGQTVTRYGMTDEESKANLNSADVQVIARLLDMQGGMDSEEAQKLAYAVIDWRDEDSFFQHPQYGAEDENYKDLSMPYESKDAPFEVLEEMLLVKGMTQDIFDGIKPFITVYAESGNINTAPKEVLSAYGLTEDLAGRIVSFRKGPDLIEGTADDAVFLQAGEIVSRLSQAVSLTIGDVAALGTFIDAYAPGVTSTNFMVHSVARLDKNNREMEITAVIHRDGQVRYWREEYRTSTDDGK